MEKTVLIIEDHTDGRELMADALEFSGYRVVQSGDGLEGEILAVRERPDLILLDITIPTKSGWEVLETLKNDEKTRSIPIVALTAHARLEDETKALAAGCASYISKPVKPKHVLKTIERILQS